MQIRDVPQGESISYGASYVTPHAMKVGVVSMGYGDGLPRGLSNIGQVIFQHDCLPIVGRVCMDYCMIDCTNRSIQVGDEVSFWGEKYSVVDVAHQLHTIPYTLTTGIQSRVQRKKV